MGKHSKNYTFLGNKLLVILIKTSDLASKTLWQRAKEVQQHFVTIYLLAIPSPQLCGCLPPSLIKPRLVSKYVGEAGLELLSCVTINPGPLVLTVANELQ